MIRQKRRKWTKMKEEMGKEQKKDRRKVEE